MQLCASPEDCGRNGRRVKVQYQCGGILGGETTVSLDVKWLIVYDEHDQPIAAIEQIVDGAVYVTTCSDEKFRDVIKRYGIDKLQRTEVVNEQS